MDPNETLAELRALRADYVNTYQEAVAEENAGRFLNAAPRFQQADELAHEIAGTFANLDDWLSGGGFAPREWREVKL